VPVGDVLVGDFRGNVEHDDTALSLRDWQSQLLGQREVIEEEILTWM
jgi:hypothetical protein